MFSIPGWGRITTSWKAAPVRGIFIKATGIETPRGASLLVIGR